MRAAVALLHWVEQHARLMGVAKRSEVIGVCAIVVLSVALAPKLGPRRGAPRFETLGARRLDFRAIDRRLRAHRANDEDWTWRAAHHALRDRAQKEPAPDTFARACPPR